MIARESLRRLALATALVALAACESTPTSTEGGRVSGTLTDVVPLGSSAVLRLEAVYSSAFYYRRMLVQVDAGTEIFVEEGGTRRPGTLADLVPQTRIDAYSAGPLLFSYPPRIRASRIEAGASGPPAS